MTDEDLFDFRSLQMIKKPNSKSPVPNIQVDIQTVELERYRIENQMRFPDTVFNSY